MTPTLNIVEEVAFLIGVALDSADRKVLIDALDYRHGGKAPAGLYEAVMSFYLDMAKTLPDVASLMPAEPFNPTN